MTVATDHPKHASHPAKSPMGLASLARALKHRNYRLFFFGQGTSMIGTWMQQTALGWLVYRLTGSTVLLGVVAFCAQIPVFCLAPLAGVLADRTDRRRLLVATQTTAMIQATVLGILTLTGVIAVWHIIALSLVLGLVNAFDIPIRQSFVVEMLESPKDLPNALALNSLTVNAPRLLGPVIAGELIYRLGEGMCFVLNAASYLAVIAALLAMTVHHHRRPAAEKSILANLKEGARYAIGFTPIRSLLMLVAAISLLGMPYTVLLPVFAKNILHGTSRTQGMLMASIGAGAIVGVFYMASRHSVRGLGKILVMACCLFGGALIAFGMSRLQLLSMALLVAAGFGTMVQMVGTNSLIQTLVDDDKRGRVMSFYTLCFGGMGPFGNLLAGGLAGAFGAPVAVMVGGTGCILAASAFASLLPRLGRMVHPIYVKMGLINDGSLLGKGRNYGDLTQEARL